MSFSFIDYIFPPVIYYAPTKQKKYFSEKDPKNKTDVENEKNVKTVEGITDGVFLPQTVLHFIPQPIPQ